MDEIVGNDDFKPDFFRDHFKASAKDAIPDREHDAVITVMLQAALRMMGSVQGRCNQDLRKFLFIWNLGIRVMKEDKDQLDRFHGDHDVRVHTNQDHKKALVRNLDQKIDDVKTKPCGGIECSVAVMHFMKAPEKFIVVVDDMPDIDAEVIDQKGQ